MKITDVIVDRYKEMKTSDMAHAEGHEIVTVKVETDVGVTGFSFIGTPIFAHGEIGDIVVRLIRRNLRNIVMGENPLHHEDLWNKMYDAPWRIGMRGMIMDCIAAIDFALWDIKAKLINRPVSDLFGGHRDKVLTYANVGQQLSPEGMGELAKKYVDQGHTTVKIRAGLSAVSLSEADSRVAAVREAIGPNVKLLVDMNGTWSVDVALDKLKKWEKHDVYWFEEPVAPEDVKGYKKIKEHAGNTLIVGGEQSAYLNDFRYLIENNALDFVQPNASCTGGITNWLKIHEYATLNGIPVSPWNLQQIHVPLAIGLDNIKWIEYFTQDRKTFQNTLLKSPVYEEEINDQGVFIKAPTAAGFGLELNEEFAEKTKVE